MECNHCIAGCLNEEDVKAQIECIQLNRQCIVICLAAAQLMSIGGEHASALCMVCVEVCNACATECEKYPQMEHCIKCAAVCRKCAEECMAMNAIAA